MNLNAPLLQKSVSNKKQENLDDAKSNNDIS